MAVKQVKEREFSDMTNDEIKRELMRQMNALCLDIGERHLGSVGEAAAANHIQEQLTAAGYSVERQSFSAPGWKYGILLLTTKHGQQQFPCFPSFYSCAG